MTVRTKKLLIVAAVVVAAGWALLVAAEWSGYIPERYVGLINTTLSPPTAVASVVVWVYKNGKRHPIPRIR
jgi:hypothetical protein